MDGQQNLSEDAASGTVGESHRQAHCYALLLGLILVVYAISAGAAAATRAIMANEAFFASPALTLLNKGYLGTTIIDGRGTWLEGIDRYTYWVPPLHLLAQAACYKVFGFGLFTLRTLSVAWGAVVLVAWYFIVRSLSRKRSAGLLCAALISTDPRFLGLAAMGRMDMMCAALGLLGLAAYLAWRERSLPVAVLAAHTLAAASCLTHFWGVLYAGGLALFMLTLDRRRIGWREVGLCAAPYVAGLCAWGIYILQAPSLFLAQFTGNVSGVAGEFKGANRWGELASPLRALSREYLLRYIHNFGYFGTAMAERIALLALAIYTVAIAACLAIPSIRRHPGYRLLLLLGAFFYLSMAWFDGLKNWFYLSHTIPMCAALLAVAVDWCYRHVRRPGLRSPATWALAATMGAFLAAQALSTVYALQHQPGRERYEKLAAYLRTHGAKPSQVIGPSSLAFYLGFDSGFVHDYRLGYYSGRRPEFIVTSNSYTLWQQQAATTEPEAHRYVKEILETKYRAVFRAGDSVVHRRIP